VSTPAEEFCIDAVLLEAPLHRGNACSYQSQECKAANDDPCDSYTAPSTASSPTTRMLQDALLLRS